MLHSYYIIYTSLNEFYIKYTISRVYVYVKFFLNVSGEITSIQHDTIENSKVSISY